MKVLGALKEKKQLRYLASTICMAAVLGFGSGMSFAAEGNAAENESLDEYSMNDVVVTASRMPTERMETPANISVVTAKEIEENHFADVSEALENVNGVTISRQGNFDGVELNGDERVVVLIDGRRLNNDQGNSTGKGRVDLKMLPSMKNIERIEVVKGGGSALYGSDAVGGVINIITKRGAKTPRTTLDLNMGSWGTYNYELATEGSAGDFSWFVTGGLQKQNHVRYKMYGQSADAPNSDKDDNSFSVRLDKNFDKTSSIRLDYEHKSKHDGNYYNAVNGKTGDAYRNEIFNDVALTYNFKEDKKAPGYLRVFDNYRGTEYDGSHFNTRLYGVDYQNGWTFGEHTIVAGGEWHESKSSNKDSGYENEALRNVAGYVQDTWKIGEKWSVVPGVRVDGNSKCGTHWTPKVAVNYHANDKTQVYASWGRVFRAPTAEDLFFLQDGGSWGMFGNPDLRPETGYTETIGVNHKFDDATSLDMSVFQSRLHDAITWMPTDSYGMIWKAMNIDHEKRRGLEISLKRRISPLWDLDLGYSYTSLEQTLQGRSVYGRNKSPNAYRFGLKYHQGPWKAGLYGVFNSGMYEQLMLARNTARIDFNLSYAVNDATTVYFKAINLTNQEYSEYPGSYNTYSRTSSYYPGSGRFFQLGVTYTF